MEAVDLHAMGWPVGLLILILGYFLRDAHSTFKRDIEKKADREKMEAEFITHRIDMRSMEERHRDEILRIERQYDVKFAGVVAQFSDKIQSVERNLGEKIDMVLKIVDSRQTKHDTN